MPSTLSVLDAKTSQVELFSLQWQRRSWQWQPSRYGCLAVSQPHHNSPAAQPPRILVAPPLRSAAAAVCNKVVRQPCGLASPVAMMAAAAAAAAWVQPYLCCGQDLVLLWLQPAGAQAESGCPVCTAQWCLNKSALSRLISKWLSQSYKVSKERPCWCT